eukprot:Gb_26051 [translate_table: standard]
MAKQVPTFQIELREHDIPEHLTESLTYDANHGKRKSLELAGLAKFIMVPPLFYYPANVYLVFRLVAQQPQLLQIIEATIREVKGLPSDGLKVLIEGSQEIA